WAALAMRGVDGESLTITSGGATGSDPAGNVNLASGAVDTGTLGVVAITNTALELAEVDTADLTPIEAGHGRLSARDDNGFTQPVWTRDDGAEQDIPLTSFQLLPVLDAVADTV